MKARIKALVAVLLCVALLAPAGVSAAGYENIGGAVHGIYYYGNPREITNPSSPGAEVAFKQYSGGYVELGIHGCNGAGEGLVSQYYNQWRAIGYSSTPRWFCIYSQYYSIPYWNGDLNWD